MRVSKGISTDLARTPRFSDSHFRDFAYSKWCHVGMAPHTKLSLSNDTDGNRGLAKLHQRHQKHKNSGRVRWNELADLGFRGRAAFVILNDEAFH